MLRDEHSGRLKVMLSPNSIRMLLHWIHIYEQFLKHRVAEFIVGIYGIAKEYFSWNQQQV